MQTGNDERNGRSAAKDAECNVTVDVESEEEWEGLSASGKEVDSPVTAMEMLYFQGYSHKIVPSSTLMENSYS